MIFFKHRRSAERDAFSVPRSVQKSIPIKRIYKDGVFQVSGKFSKTWRFFDVNYAVASPEKQRELFMTYCSFLNSLPIGATAKITLFNRQLNQKDFGRTLLMPMKGDGQDQYRGEYNNLVLGKAAESNNLIQEKYITISVEKKSVEEARAFFSRVSTDLTTGLSRMASSVREITVHDRLRLLHDFYRPGEEQFFHFDMEDTMRKGHDFRDSIAPDCISFQKDHYELGSHVGRTLFSREYASFISDSMITELTDYPRNMMLSIDIIPVAMDEAVSDIRKRIMSVESDITRWQQRQNQSNNFTANIPYDLEQMRSETKEFMDDLMGRDQRMMLALVTLTHMFSRYELKSITTRLVRGRNISASEGKFMGSVSPYGYEIYKLAGEKGNSLRIVPEQAEIVRMIYEWYAAGDGYNGIAHRLNEMHIPCKLGSHWVQNSVLSILTNEVYLGKIRWKREPTTRVIENGQVIKKRELSNDYMVFEGRHEPIISQEQWDKVRAVQASKSHLCVRKDRKAANPFANVLVCAKCGYAIRRNTPSAKQVETRKFRPWFRCATKGCDCMILYCDLVEDRVVKAMKKWWQEVTLDIVPNERNSMTEEKQLDLMRKQLKNHLEQQNQVCGLLERGVYTEEMFLKRNAVLQGEIKELQSGIEELEIICHNKGEYKQAREIFLPTTAHILDYYDRMTPEEKNRLWKLLMEKITYYRNPETPDRVEIHLYPRLGRLISIS